MTKKINKKINDSDDEYEIDENDNLLNENDDDVEDIEETFENDELEDIEDNENKNEDEYEYSDYEDSFENKEKTNNDIIPKDKRISLNRLTKYEMVRILGERTKQLTMGAKPLIKNYEGLPYEKIAEEEFKNDMIPYKIKRPLPNGKFELWNLNELSKEHLYSQLD